MLMAREELLIADVHSVLPRRRHIFRHQFVISLAHTIPRQGDIYGVKQDVYVTLHLTKQGAQPPSLSLLPEHDWRAAGM